MPDITDIIGPERAADLVRLQVELVTTGAPADPGEFRVTRVAGRVVVTRRDRGGLVLDVSAGSARQLARKLEAAAGSER